MPGKSREVRSIAFNGHTQWDGFQRHLLPERRGIVTRSVQLRNAGTVFLATATALCFLSSLLKPRAKSFPRGTPPHSAQRYEGCCKVPPWRQHRREGCASALPRCVSCTGPTCTSQKLQLRKISPEIQFVHYMPIYITKLCAKVQPE